MSVLGIFFFPVGVFLVFIGTVIALDSPFMKVSLDRVEFLRKNRRVVGIAMALVGFDVMALS
jgi:hypothetical protein